MLTNGARPAILFCFSFFFLNDDVSSLAFSGAAAKISFRRSSVRNVIVALAIFAVYYCRKLCARTVKCFIVNCRAVRVILVGFVAFFRAELQPCECAFLIADTKNDINSSTLLPSPSCSVAVRRLRAIYNIDFRSYNIIYLIFNR